WRASRSLRWSHPLPSLSNSPSSPSGKKRDRSYFGYLGPHARSLIGRLARAVEAYPCASVVGGVVGVVSAADAGRSVGGDAVGTAGTDCCRELRPFAVHPVISSSIALKAASARREVVPGLVELEVAVPYLSPAVR